MTLPAVDHYLTPKEINEKIAQHLDKREFALVILAEMLEALRLCCKEPKPDLAGRVLAVVDQVDSVVFIGET